MGFINGNNDKLINEEQKIRITLSNRAKLTMAEDMPTPFLPLQTCPVLQVFLILPVPDL